MSQHRYFSSSSLGRAHHQLCFHIEFAQRGPASMGDTNSTVESGRVGVEGRKPGRRSGGLRSWYLFIHFKCSRKRKCARYAHVNRSSLCSTVMLMMWHDTICYALYIAFMIAYKKSSAPSRLSPTTPPPVKYATIHHSGRQVGLVTERSRFDAHYGQQ